MEEVIINEEWRSISGYINYQVSNIGRVRNTNSGLIRKLNTNNNGYLGLCLSRKGKKISHEVHRLVALEFIPNPNHKPSVDHINNKANLNNTTGNLRWATGWEQQGNKSKQLNTSSQYKGVSWNKKDRRWRAYIRIGTKLLHLGYFKSEDEAALAYNKKAIEHFGEFAILNVIQHNQDASSSGGGSSSGSLTK